MDEDEMNRIRMDCKKTDGAYPCLSMKIADGKGPHGKGKNYCPNNCTEYEPKEPSGVTI